MLHAAAIVTGRHSTGEPINDTVDLQTTVGEHLSELSSDINDSPLKDRVGAIRGLLDLSIGAARHGHSQYRDIGRRIDDFGGLGEEPPA